MTAAVMPPMAFRWGWILCSNKVWTKLCACFALLALLLARPVLAIELAVVVHKNNPVVLSQEQLQHILLNKQQYFGQGQKIHLLHLPPRSPEHMLLCRQLLDLTAAQYQSYWSRLLFTGNAGALQYMEVAEVLQKVASDVDALGYVPLQELNDAKARNQVRVLGIVSEHGFQSSP